MSTCPPTSDDSESSCLSGTYALVPVHLSPVDGAGCLDAECPEDAFYTLTSEKIFTVPAVGSEANMEVCDPGAFVEGQWIQHPLGKFRITKVEPACLTVANGCPNGAAVLGNQAPGSTVSGRVPIWVTEYDCSDDSVCDQLLACLDESDNISLTNTPVADTDGGDYHLFGGEIDDACGSGTDNASKLHKIEGITSDGKTLTFKEIPEREDESEDTFWRVVGEQVDGCDDAKGVQLKIASNPANDGVYVMCGGKEVFIEVPADYDEKSYVLQPGASGCPEWAEFSSGCAWARGDLGTITPGDPSIPFGVKTGAAANVLELDAASFFDPGNILTANTQYLRVAFDGIYAFDITVDIHNNGSGKSVLTELMFNNTKILQNTGFVGPATADDGATFHWVGEMTTSDEIWLRGSTSNPSSQANWHSHTVKVCKVG